MDSKIFSLLFGIITFVVAKPKSNDSPLVITNENDLQQLLKTLYNDGKFDIAFSHHEDSPYSHHEDMTRISSRDDRSHNRHHHEDSHDYKYKAQDNSHTSDNDDNEESPSLMNIETLNLYLRKKFKNANNNNEDNETEDNARSLSNVDQVVNLLNELENKEHSENRCVGDRCGRGQSGDRDNGDIERSSNNNDNLLCFGDECGRDDVYVGDRVETDDNVGYDRNDDDENDDKNMPKCIGDSCSIDPTLLRERRLPDGDADIARLFQSQGKKIKINNDLDALVLDLSDVEKYLGNSRAKERDDNDRSQLSFLNNVDISNLIEVNKDDDEELVRDQNASKSKPIKAVVVDLSKAQNDLTSQMNDLMRNIQKRSKQYKPNKASNIKENILSRGDSRILAHNENNNHVYVPRWLLDEIVTKTNLRAANRKPKNLFPLTLKQRKRLAKAKAKEEKKKQVIQREFRRNINDDIGVPFHLQIEGLGQVEP